MSESNEKKKRKPQPIHTKKLFGGNKTAEEIYAELAVNRPCGGCGAPGITKLGTLVSLKDLQTRAPRVLAAIMATREPGAAPPVIKTIYGPMICVAEMVACKACTPEAERAASRGEREWSKQGITVHVEIRRGPGPDKPIFQVPAGPAEN